MGMVDYYYWAFKLFGIKLISLWVMYFLIFASLGYRSIPPIAILPLPAKSLSHRAHVSSFLFQHAIHPNRA